MSGTPQSDRNERNKGNSPSRNDEGSSNNIPQLDEALSALAKSKERERMLQHQLQKCTNEMKWYQSQYPGLRPGAVSLDDMEPLPAWITDPKIMSPLIVAYEKRIQDLTQLTKNHDKELGKIRGEYAAWMTRTQRAQTDLENNVVKIVKRFEHASAITVGSEGRGAGLSGDALGTVHELQEHVATLKERLEISRKQESQTQSQIVQLLNDANAHRAEIESLHNVIEQGDHEKHQANDTINQIQGAKQRLFAQITHLTSQVTTANREKQVVMNELQNAHRELSLVSARHEQYRRKQEEMVQSFTRDRRDVRAELQTFAHSNQELSAQVEHLEKALDIAEEKLRLQTRELDAGTQDFKGVVQSLESVEKTLAVYKGRVAEAARMETEAAQKVASAELERDQALAREKREKLKLDRVTNGMNAAIAEAQRTAEAGIKGVYTKAKLTEQKLLEDVRSFQLACGEMENARALSEQKAYSLQAKLDRVASLASEDQERLSTELNKLLCVVTEKETEHATAIGQAQRATRMLEMQESQWRRERTVLTAQAKDAHDSLEARNLEVRTLAEANLKLTEERDTTLNRLRHLELDSAAREDNMEQKYVNALNAASQESNELKMRLDEAYSQQDENEARLTELVAARELSMKAFRDDTRENLNTFRKVLNEQKDKINSLTNRNQSLLQQADQAIAAREHALAQFEHQAQLLVHFQAEAENAQHQLLPLSSQVAQAEVKERQLEEQISRLRLELERTKVEQERRRRHSESMQKRMDFQRQSISGIGSEGLGMSFVGNASLVDQ